MPSRDGETPQPYGYTFEQFRLNVAGRELWRNGESVPLTARSFDTLVVLVRNRGRVVSKDELMKAVWHDSIVSDDSLTQNIRTLRRALGDDAAHPEFIATVARRGYRFLPEVTEVAADDAAWSAPAPGPDLLETKAEREGQGPSVAPALTSRLAGVLSNRPWWAAAGLVLAALGSLIFWRAISPSPEEAPAPTPLRLALREPSGTTLEPGASLSPNGDRIVFVARETLSGKASLWSTDLESGQTQSLAGTDGARTPFWSPDSRYVGFFADGNLMTTEPGSGLARTVTRVRTGEGGSWAPNGRILFGDFRSPIYALTASAAETAVVTALDRSRSEVAHRWPQFLPDGRHFLYFIESGNPEYSGTYVGALGSDMKQRLVPFTAVYASNHLFYVRDGTLLAQPFEFASIRLRGTPSIIAADVPPVASGSISVAPQHLLIYGSDSNVERFVWFDRSGRSLGVVDTPPGAYNPALSTDQRYVLAGSGRQDLARGIWLIDLERGASTRLTDGMRPTLSPDGSRLAFTSDRTGHGDLYIRSMLDAGSDELLVESDENKVVSDWSPDGRYLVYISTNVTTKADLWLLPASRTASPVPFLRTPFNEHQGQVSPDGRWIAYSSDESGTWEVYVQSFPDPGAKRTVSVGGGAEPQWRQDGRELFYLSPALAVMAVDVTPGVIPEFGRPRMLFRAPMARGRSTYLTHYDVAPDGQRFLVHSFDPNELPASMSLLVHWGSLLER